MPSTRSLALLAALVLLSVADPLPAQSRSPSPAPASRPAPAPHVILVRGIAGYWPGVERLEARLHQQGCHTITCRPLEARAAGCDIARACRQGWIGSVRIIAYSAGADAAIELARSIGEHGVWVDRLILIEATNPGTIPPNVRYVYNLYESRPLTDWMPLFRGQQVWTESRQTRVVNHDVRDRDLILDEANHFTMATQPRAQALVAWQALAVPPRTQLSAPTHRLAGSTPEQHPGESLTLEALKTDLFGPRR